MGCKSFIKAVTKNLIGTKVSPKYRSEYGLKYSPQEAKIAAYKIAKSKGMIR